MLTAQQLVTLRAAIEGDPALINAWNAGDIASIERHYGAQAVPDFFVWRTNVTRAEIYHQTSGQGTTWNWTTYKNQGVAEQNAWVQMFMGDIANFALPNLRAGVAAIFTGSAQANAQRDHCLATAKRAANNGEKLLASGVGSLASPATMSFEGALTDRDIEQAMEQ